MQKIIKTSLFALLLGFTACQEQSATIESVNAERFAKVIDGRHVQILDVRGAEEFTEGHIANSINIDVTQEDFTQKAKSVLKKKRAVALYCRSGRRSKKAVELLHKEGYKVVELAGGFNEWKEAKRDIAR